MSIKKIYVVADVSVPVLESIIARKPLSLVKETASEGSIWLHPDKKEYIENKQLIYGAFPIAPGTKLDEDYLGALQMALPLYWAEVAVKKTDERTFYQRLAALSGIGEATILEHPVLDNQSRFTKNLLGHLINYGIGFRAYALNSKLEFLSRHEPEKGCLEVNFASGMLSLRTLPLLLRNVT